MHYKSNIAQRTYTYTYTSMQTLPFRDAQIRVQLEMKKPKLATTCIRPDVILSPRVPLHTHPRGHLERRQRHDLFRLDQRLKSALLATPPREVPVQLQAVLVPASGQHVPKYGNVVQHCQESK